MFPNLSFPSNKDSSVNANLSKSQEKSQVMAPSKNGSANSKESVPRKPHWYGNVAPSNKALTTPMMKQFVELKKTVPDALLLYRMGDFYELFLNDAVVAGDILDLNVTSRNKKDKEPVPMAGIPHHALEGYLQRLSKAGYKVAIAEQKQDLVVNDLPLSP